ncbi:fimbrillin family protein [uncultured Alistipes sp.]|uniref:fimbrillin family protein n=1 Tax=uncultured Alistipes sp. TaxID=538949 RepID=UPI0025EF98D3|nr:fimbrillin family protein [uncultured Alistipes sp.]
MKNIKSTIIGLTLALVGLTACQSDNEPVRPGGSADVKVQIKSEATLTRTYMTGDRETGDFKTHWEVGDALGVYTAGATSDRKFTIEEGGISGDQATFSGTLSGVNGDVMVYAYYPWDDTDGNINEVKSYMPYTQTMKGNSHDPAADFMVALPQPVNVDGDNVTLEGYRFRYLVSFINLTMEVDTGANKHETTIDLSEKVLSVAIQAPGKGLAGAITLDLEAGTFTPVSVSSAVSVYVPANTTVGNLSAWLVTLPFDITTEDKLVVEIMTEKHSISKEITAAAIDFTAGRVKTLNMNVNKDCTITDATPEAPEIPDAVFISGSGVEYGDKIDQAKAMRKLSDGVFEIYCSMTAGSSFRLADGNEEGNYVAYAILDGKLSEAGPNGSFDTPDADCQYRVTADFNARTVTCTTIGVVVFEREGYRNDSRTMSYDGDGKWSFSDLQFTDNQDERYHFRISHRIGGDPVGNGGDWHEKWGSMNRDNSVPNASTPGDYWDVVTYRSPDKFYESNPNEADWDYCFKLRDRSPGKADILLDMNAPTQHHIMTYK